MKTQAEIEQLAEQYTQDGIYLSDSEKQQTEIAYMSGYTQCQEDMADKKYTEKDVQNILDGFTNEAPGEYIKTNFIELLNKQD